MTKDQDMLFSLVKYFQQITVDLCKSKERFIDNTFTAPGHFAPAYATMLKLLSPCIYGLDNGEADIDFAEQLSSLPGVTVCIDYTSKTTRGYVQINRLMMILH